MDVRKRRETQNSVIFFVMVFTAVSYGYYGQTIFNVFFYSRHIFTFLTFFYFYNVGKTAYVYYKTTN